MSACVLWHGAVNGDGYGSAHIGRHRYARAHRHVWTECFGEIPPGVVLHHECGVKLCVNPEHLRATTAAEHMGEHVNIHRARAVAVANQEARPSCPRGHAYAEHGFTIPAGQRDAGTRTCRECHRLGQKAGRYARKLGYSTGVRRVRPWLPASTDLAYATASDDGLVTGVDSLDVGDGALAVPALDPSEAT